MLYFYTTYLLLSRNVLLYIQANWGQGTKKKRGVEWNAIIALLPAVINNAYISSIFL